ncbi:MAG: hypothetical protein GHCLOJNM_04379 [bacterium]|nr:hypothetical protein [bacterium]
MFKQHMARGFTLIELLIVIAIILILIAIALPNFLEAQIRSKIAHVRQEMRTLTTATESYRVQWNMREPKTDMPGLSIAGTYSEWWGFASHLLTTPIRFLTELPFEPFTDDYTIGFWRALSGAESDPPYTVIRNTAIAASWPIGSVVTNNPEVQQKAGGPVPISELWNTSAKHSAFIYYSSGADRVDSTVWGTPQFYSPTNGTVSFGDIYEFGSGSPIYDPSKPPPMNLHREDFNY